MEDYRYEFIAPSEMLDIHLEFFIDPGQSVINKHHHDWIEIIYLINGDLEVQINNETIEMEKNDFVVINPMTIHSTRCRGGNTAILVQIPLSFLENFVPDIREYSFFVDLSSKDARTQTKLGDIRSTLQSLWIAYQFQAEGYQFRCYSLIFELIYILVHSFSKKMDRNELRRNQKNLERIETIIGYVKNHYREPISIREIAGEVGLNAISIIHLEKGEKTEFLNTRTPVEDCAIYLRLYIRGRQSWFEWSYDGVDYQRIGRVFDTTKFSDEYCKFGEFTGTMVGLTCADRVRHRHYADFDFFEYVNE